MRDLRADVARVQAEIATDRASVARPCLTSANLPSGTPPCIQYILDHQREKTDKANFNEFALNLVCFFKERGYTSQGTLGLAANFIEEYRSETHPTPAKRTANFESVWKSVQGNKGKYKFDCTYVLGLGLPGSGFECKKCPLRAQVGEPPQPQATRPEVQTAAERDTSNDVKKSNNESKSKICGMSLSAMKTRFSQTILWLFSKLIPARMPIIINGREGMGKTMICLAIAKAILEQYPDHIIYWVSTEGTVADTFIKAIDLGLPDGPFQIAAKGEDDFLFNFRNEQEQKLLDNLLSTAPKPVIAVFIDSVRGMTSQDPNSEEIGNTMRRLNAIVCDKHQAALIYLHHWNKKAGASWLDRNTGSTAITAAVRLVLSVLPNSKYSRKLVVSKCNIADHIPAVNVVKQGEELHFYDDEETGDDSQLDQCETFLLSMFKDQKTRFARDIYKAGEEQGYSADTLKRAKGKLKIESTKSSEGGWIWTFPGNVHSSHPCSLGGAK